MMHHTHTDPSHLLHNTESSKVQHLALISLLCTDQMWQPEEQNTALKFYAFAFFAPAQ